MSQQQSVRIQTKSVALEFEVDAKSRLVQSAFGGDGEQAGVVAIPASGDGWVFEPGLRVVHADGNTSLDLVVEGIFRDGELTRFDLRDPEYPFFVQLFVRALFELDTYEIWSVIRHEESSPVVLEAFASSCLDFGGGEFWLTQFSGDWADEANMSSERLGAGIKVLDSKLGVRAHQFTAPWIVLSKGGLVRTFAASDSPPLPVRSSPTSPSEGRDVVLLGAKAGESSGASDLGTFTASDSPPLPVRSSPTSPSEGRDVVLLGAGVGESSGVSDLGTFAATDSPPLPVRRLPDSLRSLPFGGICDTDLSLGGERYGAAETPDSDQRHDSPSALVGGLAEVRRQLPSEDEGIVFAGSLAWAGSFRFSFEVLPNRRLRTVCGMNPFGSRYRLGAGESFATPKMVWAYSDRGTGELSRKLHRYVREDVIRDGGELRSVLLNNWEATYFSFDEEKIVSLFDGAKELGIELFLLDDGWFGSKYPRDDDTQGLGDWEPDLAKLPHGLRALTDAAQKRGLKFGIWFEPEMVNPRSELFEKHPDWLIRQPKREMELQRNQMVLDLTNPEVRDFAYGILDKALRENPGIEYIKWDCNRYFTQPGSSYLGRENQSHLQIEYVGGLYEVMGRLAIEHPGVKVMMCSGGGGRVDYGSMRYAHELWPSDMTDPERRVFIQWGFSHFFPALTMASHVTLAGERPLKFAFDVAMSGRMGLDIDLAKLSENDLQFAARAIETYKEIRPIVQLGELYRLESPYSGPRASLMYGYGDRAVVFVYPLGDSPAGPVVLKGLDRDRLYQVQEINAECGKECTLSGASLCEQGLPMAGLGRFESVVLVLSAI